MSAMLFRGTIVTMDESLAITDKLAAKPTSVLANGWDPLLQTGLENPTKDSLDKLARDIPLVIFHNSGHTAYFNSAARAGVDASTPGSARSIVFAC